MAFYQSPPPTNDPNYLGQSKEPDKIKFGSDEALGNLFGDIGKTANVALKATQDIFETKIKDSAHALIDPIMDRHGTGLDLESVRQVAGTGAKGRVRAEQMQYGADPFVKDADGGGVDSDGGEGLDIVPTTQAKPLPPQAAKEISNLTRLQQAYNAGNLSDSYFNAQLLAVTKQLRNQYPGFRDEVDAAVSRITGVQPANALRSSLMRDIQANQAAALAQQSADDKLKEKYRGEIAAEGFDPETTPKEVWLPAVNRRLGTKKINEAALQDAEAGSVIAEKAVSDSVALTVQQSISAAGNRAQGNMSYQEFRDRLSKAAVNGLDPKEQNVLVDQMQRQRDQLAVELRTRLYAPIPNRADGHSPVTLMKGGDAKLSEIINNQLKPWDDMITLAKTGSYSSLETVTNMNKLTNQRDLASLYQRFPQARVATAISNAFPNNPIMQNRFLETSSILPDWQKAVKDGIGNAILGGSESTPAPKPSEALDVHKSTAEARGATSGLGSVAKETLKQYDLVISKENKNLPNAAHVANQFFSDQKFYDQLSADSRMKTFMTMVSPEKTKYIQSLVSQDASVLQNYQNWVKYAAGDIFRRNADDLNSLLVRKDIDVAFNPTTMQFEDRTPRTGQTWASHQEGVRRNIQSINNAIALTRPVMGDNPGAVLSALGIDPSPKKEDGIVTRMFDALGAKVQEWRNGYKAEEVIGGERKAAPTPGKQSMNDLPAAALRQVTAEAESSDDYNAVFGLGKNSKRDLSAHTVGEIMAIQKHYTDSGSPSSAAGKYQFLRKTLQSLVNEGVIAKDEPFTPDVQERAFTALANRRGLSKFVNGEIDEGTFMNSLAQEWAGLPTTNGMSFYSGDGLNKSTVSPKRVLEAIRRIKQEG